MTSRRRFRLLIALVLATALLAACSSKPKGPDLTKAVTEAEGINATLSTPTVEPERFKDADKVWIADGSVTEVGAAIRAKAGEPSDTVNEADASFFLYRSGTVWITGSGEEGKSAVSVYFDNERARSLFPLILLGNAGWGNTVSGFGGGSGSNDNGFRGGGSGSGK